MRIPVPNTDFQPSDEIADLAPVFEHDFFQRLRNVSQTGQTSLVFPGATHTRFVHSLGVAQLAKQYAPIWQQRGLIAPDRVPLLCLASLVHDIGHIAYAHALEPLLSVNHHKNGLRLLEAMREQIALCSVDPDELLGFLQGKDPLFEAVSHGLFGWDKIQYMQLDPAMSGYGGSADFEKVLGHTRPYEGRVVVEKKAVSELLNLRRFMFTMYSRVYERSQSAYARRIVQKLYERMLALGLITEPELLDMNDVQFQARAIAGSENDPAISYFYKKLCGQGGRSLPQTAVLICLSGYGQYHRRNDKPLRRVIEVDAAMFQRLDNAVRWNNASAIEDRLTGIAGDHPNCIFIQPSKNPRRYELPETTLLDGNETYSLASCLPPRQEGDPVSGIRIIRVGASTPNALRNLFERSDEVVAKLAM